MSTKLYDGLRIKNTTEEEVIEKLENLKPLFQNELKKAISKKISNEYFKLVDNIFNNPKPLLPYEYAKGILESEMEKVKNNENSLMFQNDFTVFIKKYKSDVYLYPFFREKEDLDLLFKKIPELEEFGYWDNTDKPDGVSESHWKKREDIWNKVYEKYTFEESGFKKISLNNIKDLSDIKFDYDSFIDKDKEKRFQTALKNIYISVVYKKITKNKSFEEITHSMYMEAVDHYLEDSTRNIDLVKEIKVYLKNNIREINKDNFYSIEALPFKEFKTEIKL